MILVARGNGMPGSVSVRSIASKGGLKDRMLRGARPPFLVCWTLWAM